MTASASPISFRKIIAIWLVAATVALLQSATQLVHLRADRRNWILVVPTFVGWMLWAVLTPTVIRLTRRVPIVRARLARALVVHLGAALGCVVLLGSFWETISRTLVAAGAGTSGFWRQVLSPVGHAMVGFVTYGCIVAAVTAYDAVERSHRAALATARLERDVAQAREQAIKMQVHPHFLFNTLHAVSVLITEDPATARAMVVHLGDFLRATLARAGLAEVPLRDELELLAHYLDVERLRFGDRLVVEVDATDEVLDAYVPDLILQPLAENAIKHGVSTRTGAHRIRVCAVRRGARLELTVEDDGANDVPSDVREGIGLRSTRSRLAHLYGDEGMLTLAPRPDGGARATVSLPYHVAPVDGDRDAEGEDDVA
ncbi:sensor histidine kinase [Roseisolibacter agri]|uniref:ATPase n=1 Tax=Roseisolibacter agri TaxID=2014610 RepID=A0AA37QCJ9_9BACT|nr:histidine kinase [Roseisolibacter agri]GLC26391.1 ATPase [Roseisolibacter agri]